MNAINCVLVPVGEFDYGILAKMRMFGIFAPDEDKVLYGRGIATPHYCISHVKSRFDEYSFAALDAEEISDSTKMTIKAQYLKICSLAFMFGIGKDCVRDKYNRLIPIDLASRNQPNIFQNNNRAYSPRLVSEITEDVYDRLHHLQECKIITSDQKWQLIDKYQEQLDIDDLILEEIDLEQLLSG